MKTPIPVGSLARFRHFFSFGLLLFFIHSPQFSYSQCAAAPVAAAACSGGNGAATNGVTITAGQTYWVTGTTSVAGITLSGGTLRVCGTLNVTTLNFGSGKLIVEAGGTANISTFSSSNLNGNVVFINRGTTQITTSFTMQNPGNAIYNDLSTSVFTVSGTVTDNNALIVNRGNMSLSGLTYQATAGNFCVQDQSITTIGALDNETTNSFSYSGLGSPACVNVTGSAILNHDFTNTNKIHVCKGGSTTVSGGATANPGGGWGSAVVTSNCSSCATVLPLNIIEFTARLQSGAVELKWTDNGDLTGNEVFYAQKSVDGINFYTIGSLEARVNQDTYAVTDPELKSPNQYYRVLLTNPFSGTSVYSPIVVVATSFKEPLSIYPNPVGPGNAIMLTLRSSVGGMAGLSLVNMAGQTVSHQSVEIRTGSNQLSWDPGTMTTGIYILKIVPPGGGILYNRIMIGGAVR